MLKTEQPQTQSHESESYSKTFLNRAFNIPHPLQHIHVFTASSVSIDLSSSWPQSIHLTSPSYFMALNRDCRPRDPLGIEDRRTVHHIFCRCTSLGHHTLYIQSSVCLRGRFPNIRNVRKNKVFVSIPQRSCLVSCYNTCFDVVLVRA